MINQPTRRSHRLFDAILAGIFAIVLSTTTLATPANAIPLQQASCPAVIVEVFEERAKDACYVSWRESSWRSWATGSLGEKGYFQIHPIHGYKSTHDPYLNTLYAYQMSRGGYDWCGGGWAWTC